MFHLTETISILVPEGKSKFNFFLLKFESFQLYPRHLHYMVAENTLRTCDENNYFLKLISNLTLLSMLKKCFQHIKLPNVLYSNT